MGEWNRHRTAIVDLLSYWHTSVADALPQALVESEFEEATEMGEPVSLRPPAEYLLLGYDFMDYDRASRFTWRFLRDADARQVRAAHDEALRSDNTTVTRRILARLFNPEPALNEQGVVCYGLWNGNDNITPPPVLGKSFDASHSHYLVSGSGVVDAGDLEDSVSHIREHGYGQLDSAQELIAFVNPAESEVIQTFRAGSESENGVVSKWDFIRAINQPAFILQEQGQLVGGQPPGTIFSLGNVGKYGPVWVVESNFIPEHWFTVAATSGPASPSNPVGVRQHANVQYHRLAVSFVPLRQDRPRPGHRSTGLFFAAVIGGKMSELNASRVRDHQTTDAINGLTVNGRPGLSVGAARMWCMASSGRVRRIDDPVVAAAPGGVRIRTRLQLTDAEAAALAAVGDFLGAVYRAELAGRIRLGRLDGDGRARWRAERKQAVTALASSRWAGAITRAVEDQYQLGMRGLVAHVAGLRKAVHVLAERCALMPGQFVDAHASTDSKRGRRRQCRGYRSSAERSAKTRRLGVLRARLATAEQALSTGQPSIVLGGKRLWRTRNHLDEAKMSQRQWRARWDAARMFLTADGESGKAGGNETIRIDESGRVHIKVPAALIEQFGRHIVIAARARFVYRGGEWADRVAARRAIRYDITHDPSRSRWYLHASWKTSPDPVRSLTDLRAARVLAVDLNADHLAGCALDASGNLVGKPATVELVTGGLAASRRDGRVRAAISAMLNTAQQHNCGAVVIENLDFADARATGRETLGRGVRGKRLRRTIAGIPTAKFRTRLTAMATRRGIAVIGVDPAYTSRWGDHYWRKPWQQQTSEAVTRHHAAAAAIGRRGLGMAIRRRPAGPRSGQRTAAGTPPGRPDHHPSTTRRRRSSGPPLATRWMPVHRTTPAASGQHRSGRN